MFGCIAIIRAQEDVAVSLCEDDCQKEIEGCAAGMKSVEQEDFNTLLSCMYEKMVSERVSDACAACVVREAEHMASEAESKAARKQELLAAARNQDVRERNSSQKRAERDALIVALSVVVCLLMIVTWALRNELKASRGLGKANLVHHVGAQRYDTTSVAVEETQKA